MDTLIDSFEWIDLSKPAMKHGMRRLDVSPVVHERFKDRLGPFVMSQLRLPNSEEVLVSGSIVLDVLNNTYNANDIDLFCIPRRAYDICADARSLDLREWQVKMDDQRYTDQDTFLRYQIEQELRQDDVFRAFRVDVTVTNHPHASVMAFDLSCNKVAYDGECLWVSPEWVEHAASGTYAAKWTTGQAEEFLKELEAIPRPVVFHPLMSTNHRRYDLLSLKFSMEFIRFMIRLGKYTKRGFTIISDGEQKEYPLTAERLQLLYELMCEKPKPIHV